MTRQEKMRELLISGEYFKLVCGAGNEDTEEVKRLATIYTLAGANAFDVSANEEVVLACCEGIDKAYQLSKDFNIDIEVRPFVNISIGLPGDHHVRKAAIDLDKCTQCMKCISICPKDAIPKNLVVIKDLCIGCGHCDSICVARGKPISFKHNNKSIEDIVPKCISAGAETIELHAAIADNESIMNEWRQVVALNPNHFNSMCMDRAQLSNTSLIQRVREACEIGKEYTIIQADGVPMSGGKDNFQTTVQAIAIAELLQKEFVTNPKKAKRKDFFMLLSGGTNSHTAELAYICDINYHGLSLGTHARKIVKDYVKNSAYEDSIQYLKKPIEIAKDLISKQSQIKKKYETSNKR